MWAVVIGAFTGIIISQMHRRQNIKLALPFVPFMAAGAIITMLHGKPMWEAYLNYIYPPERLPLTAAEILRDQKAEERRLQREQQRRDPTDIYKDPDSYKR
jgi:hypothetical protein